MKTLLISATVLGLAIVGCAASTDSEESSSSDSALTNGTSWKLSAGCNSASARSNCAIETAGGAIANVRVAGDPATVPQACQGEGSFGFSSNGIWVSNGCSADFEIDLHGGFGDHGDHGDHGGGGFGGPHGGPGGPGGGHGDHGDHGGGWGGGPGGGHGGYDVETVSCASWNNRYTTCNTSIDNIRQVRLVRQESSSPCTEGRTFGTTGDSIWVDRGCRGQFEVSGYGHGHGDHGGGDHGGGGHGGGGHGGGDDAVVLYDQYGYNGIRFSVNSDIDNFVNMGFNDRASSMVINEGFWDVCEDVGYRGRCQNYGPGSYSDLGALSRQVSSMRRR